MGDFLGAKGGIQDGFEGFVGILPKSASVLLVVWYVFI